MPITGKPVIHAAALVLFGLAMYPAMASAQLAPSSVVETFDAELLGAMKNPASPGPAGRYERLVPAMAAAFDLAEMTERESSTHWSRLTTSQKERLVAAYGAFETALFADWFDAYVGQSIAVEGSHVGADGTVTVNTVMSGGVPALSLDYLVRAGKDGRWQIVDVRYGGWLSVVECRRSEFTEILAHGGVETLISRLDAVRQAALGHPDNAAAPHLLQPRTDQWTLPVYPID